jgi:hypothetical protein
MKLSSRDITLITQGLRKHAKDFEQDKEYIKILEELQNRLNAEFARLHNKQLIKAGLATTWEAK